MTATDYVMISLLVLLIFYCVARLIIRAYFKEKSEYANNLISKAEELRRKWQKTGS